MVKAALIPLAVVASAAQAFDTKIINGTEAPIGKFLYTTGFRTEDISDDYCVGALIAPKYVLTGATCVHTLFKYASVGSHYLSGKDGERIKIVKQIRHPLFDHHEFDFAIFELETASKIAPVKVNFDPVVTPGSWATVRGWGKFSDAEYTPSQVLLEADVKVWDNVECAKVFAAYGPIMDTHICAGGADKDWCTGDSGAPLIVNKAGEDYVVGLASWGSSCATKNVPGVYARTSSARDFIEPYLSTNPVPTNPVPTNPVPTKPVPTTPVPTKPVPTTPVPTNPVPTTTKPSC
ncbi:hypothetical protein B5M09_013510 [Aphanomyces astaci]|uniref:Peptidase S1 domain-containing protein n=1 Tax=Aphanomyces astaci TaxID=112090 RepID=A0A425CR62_APHAT|nr:hypothetical protein B5M09_013510 [Aphanomyces astaci]